MDEQNEQYQEDAEDIRAFEERKNEPTISYDEMIKRLNQLLNPSEK